MKSYKYRQQLNLYRRHHHVYRLLQLMVSWVRTENKFRFPAYVAPILHRCVYILRGNFIFLDDRFDSRLVWETRLILF